MIGHGLLVTVSFQVLGKAIVRLIRSNYRIEADFLCSCQLLYHVSIILKKTFTVIDIAQLITLQLAY
jgi:hypothetical protein